MAITAHDIVPDSPTNNFATWNPLYKGSNTTISNGNLNVASSSTGGRSVISTIAFDIENDNFYCELLLNSTGSTFGIIGIESPDVTNYIGYSNTSYGYSTDGGIYHNSSSTSYGATYTTTNVIGMAVGSGAITFYKNGVSQGVAVSGLSGKFYVGVGALTMDNYINFGQDPTFAGNKNTPATVNINGTNVTGPFAPSGDAEGTAGLFYYPPPAGALALCTANLPDFTPTVTGDTPQDYFKTVLYTGQTADSTFIDNGDNTWSKTGVGFQPDLVWVKSSNDTTGHRLVDSVRGDYNFLESNTTGAEGNNTNQISLDADGFTTGSSVNTNSNGKTYVAWCFRSGGNSNTFNINGTGYSTYSALQTDNTSLPAITSGMIEPSGMSINTDAGFSIVSYSGNGSNGATVPHGLTQTPDSIIVKNRSGANSWRVYHKIFGTSPTETLYLDISNSRTGDSNIVTGVSSSIFSLGITSGNASVNATSNNYIAYCWHSVEGYSKFGSYTGNGSADGPFVYTGFKPAWVMIKRTDALDNWLIQDSTRTPFNWTCNMLVANNSNQENTTEAESTYGRDYLSNGFKIRASHSSHNATNGTYIFMAFAEQPFKFSNAR